MSFVLQHMCFICGPCLATWGLFIVCQSWPRLFPTLSCDLTTVLRQLLGFGECSFLSLPCSRTLACAEKSAPFDGLLAGELNRISETSKKGSVFLWTALSSCQYPCSSTVCQWDKDEPNAMICLWTVAVYKWAYILQEAFVSSSHYGNTM